MFEPTITLFSKATTVSYKKVGTRFLRLLSVGNKKLQHTNNRQIDMVLKPTRTITSTQGDNFNNVIFLGIIKALAECHPAWPGVRAGPLAAA